MWCDTHSAKETEQQKEQWGLGLEVMGKWGEGGQNLKKRGEGVLHKIVGLARLCQLCEETLKIFHPPIIKPTPAPPFQACPTFLVKISHPLITAILGYV